jgi:hypothetical protein
MRKRRTKDFLPCPQIGWQAIDVSEPAFRKEGGDVEPTNEKEVDVSHTVL